MSALRAVILADTHGRHAGLAVPAGDLLVHCGDLTMAGGLAELRAALAWLAAQPHEHKLLIAGNHDWAFQRQPQLARALLRDADGDRGRLRYLEESGCTVAGRRVWGSPWTPWYMDWAFNGPRGGSLASRWRRMPDGLDLLVTHGPPLGVLDRCPDGRHAGDPALLRAVRRAQPRAHAFGHIHAGRGVAALGGTTCVNVAICDEEYRATGAPVVVDL